MLYVIILIILMVLSHTIRTIVFHPVAFVYYSITDFYKYIRFRRWRECKPGKHYGMLNMYVGNDSNIFGSGKTLSAVHWLLRVYKKYNGKKVYNFDKKCWEIQHIRIVSNVKLQIPYIKLASTKDIIDAHKGLNESSIALVFIDEAGTQFNSRNFKTNISSTLLNSMMTCRHEKFGMVLTSPRYTQVDSLMRQITRRVIECKKVWRFQFLYNCSAWDMENCTNVKLVKHMKSCWFVKNKDYNAYDTHATVDEIKRMQKNGELLSDSEVLALQGQEKQTDVYKLGTRTSKVKKIYKG